jgi:hypothetical protein
MRPFPLERGKDQLRKLLLGCMTGIKFNEHLENDGATVFVPCLLALLRGHRQQGPLASLQIGPSKTWIKVKNPEAPVCSGSRITIDL